MDSKDSTERTAGSLRHPDQAEWMAFLYGEAPAKAKRELKAHLEACSACSAQVESWRSSMAALDSWKVPRRRAATIALAPAAKWTVAAAVLMLIGFFLGRHGSPSAKEIADLKTSVARLNQFAQSESPSSISNSVVAAANEQTIRLLAEYSRGQEEQRATDRQSINVAFRALQIRMNRLDSDLQTVAADTETGFEQTHENIARVVSLSMAPTQPNISTPQ